MEPTTFATTDLSDAHPDVPAVAPLFRDYGGRVAFHGPIRTLRVHDDNTLVRATLETPGDGAVLVVDGGGSLRCALVGGNLGKLAVDNSWAGIVVFGAVRDSLELAQCAVGVRALAVHPKKSKKGGAGDRDVAVTFADVTFTPGAWLYADADGMLVSDTALHG